MKNSKYSVINNKKKKKKNKGIKTRTKKSLGEKKKKIIYIYMKTSQVSQKAILITSHQVSRCQVVFTKNMSLLLPALQLLSLL